jgi:hypothetical protein
MESKFDIEAVVANLAPAKVRRASPSGIFEVTFPRKGIIQKTLLLQRLYDVFPVRLLWLCDFVNEPVRRSLGTPMSTNGGAAIWTLPTAISPAILVDCLGEGSWAMFFLRDAPKSVTKLPEVLRPETGSEVSLLAMFSGEVGILSFEDDVEWTIISSAKPKQV